ncbi:MAG: hypothetical protein U0836_26980 [Pirellulales bacterium]
MANQLLEQAAQLTRERRDHAERDYLAMVSLLSSGGDAPPEDVLAIVEAAGHTLDELQQDLERIESREQAKAEVKKLAEVEARLEQVAEERAALKRELEEHTRRIGLRDSQLNEEQNALGARQAGLATIKGQLDSGKFYDRATVARRNAATKRAHVAAQAVRLLGPELKTAENELKAHQNALDAFEPSEGPNSVEGYKPRVDEQRRAQVAAQVAAAKRVVDRLKQQLAPAEAELAAANAELEQIRQEQAA